MGSLGCDSFLGWVLVLWFQGLCCIVVRGFGKVEYIYLSGTTSPDLTPSLPRFFSRVPCRWDKQK